MIRRFLRVFSSVADRRVDSMTDYPLTEILLITFLAVLANASTWTGIARFGEEKKRWLRKFLRLKNGIPSHDTCRRVFSLIDGNTLQKSTVSFLVENMAALRKIPQPGRDQAVLPCAASCGKEEWAGMKSSSATGNISSIS